MNIDYKKIGLSSYLTTKDKSYLAKGKAKGIDKLFISLHIVEQFNNNFLEEVKNFLKALKQYNFKEIICDISPIGIKKLGTNWWLLLKKYHITTLRLDYGFSDQEISDLAQKIPVAINASQVSKNLLDILKKQNLINQVIAFHNYYPLPGTGLSYQKMLSNDILLRTYGIKKIYSFMPGQKNWRKNTLQAGLPTLENHRHLNSWLIYQELVNDFNHQCVFIGDPDFFNINQQENIVTLNIDHKYLKAQKYQIRVSNNFIRFKNTRMMSFSESGVSKVEFQNIKSENLQAVKKGDLVICNENSKRYMGEIMLCIKDLDSQFAYLFNKLTKLNIKNNQIKKIINDHALMVNNSK